MTAFAPYLAEAIGTFALIFIGAGAVCANAAFPQAGIGVTGIAFAHGLTIMLMVYIFGPISGTHINPAVTLSLLATKHIDIRKAVGYLVAQLAGAAVAGILLKLIFGRFPAAIAVAFGTTDLGPSIGPRAGFAVEFVLTFLLVAAVFGMVLDARTIKPPMGIVIGLTVTLAIFMGGPLTGAAMNPARHFGPALAAGHWANTWIYWAGPLLGGVTAAVLYDRVFLKK